ncbi:malate dehydrogenase [Moniliophthora roreri]|nr:malate dehydrogenase [Moniliophthora roreri]
MPKLAALTSTTSPALLAPPSASSRLARLPIGDATPFSPPHYFVPNPKWNLVSSFQNADAFVVGARQAAIPAPSGRPDIDGSSAIRFERDSEK